MKILPLKMKTILCLLIVFVAVGKSLGLTCYSCKGGSGSKCMDPFLSDNIPQIDCEAEHFCVTIKEGTQYTRSCSANKSCETGCYGTDETDCTHCCNRDLCNAMSVSHGLEYTVNCYSCMQTFFESPAPDDSGPCGLPFDASKAYIVPCDKDKGCKTQYESGADIGSIIRRDCVTADQCQSKCVEYGCVSCCSGNLCNSGPFLTPDLPTNEPVSDGSGAQSAIKQNSLTRSLIFVSLVAVVCL